MPAQQTVPAGVYAIRGPMGYLDIQDRQLTMMHAGTGPRWQVDSGKNGYTIRHVDTGTYVGTDDPSQPNLMINGTTKPFTWTLEAGPDDDPTTFFLTAAVASNAYGKLRLTPSPIMIWPPKVALVPPAEFRDFEWRFENLD